MIKNKKLNIEITGDGFPIVFIHSFLWDKTMWEPQIKELSKKYKCVNIDLHGHGKSDFLEKSNEYSLDQLTDDILDSLVDLNLKEYFYIGLSVGGMLAPYLYEKQKNKIKKMVIMDSYSGIENETLKLKYFNMLDIILKEKKVPEYIIKEVVPMFFSYKTLDKQLDIVDNFKKSLREIKEENIETIVTLGKAIFGRKNKLKDLKNIDIPVLFMGGEDDIPRPICESIEMNKIVKNSIYKKIPNSGHISNLENPDFVTKEIVLFLTK